MKQAKRLPLCFLILLCSFAANSNSEEKRSNVCPQDEAQFAKSRQKAAEKDPAAQTTLASCYDLGRHVQPDGREAIRLLTEAAEQGYGPAEYELGRIYLYGRGVPADYAKALLWEMKAARQGDARAQRDLAFMYERGFGVAADPVKAAEWNRKAAEQGSGEAQLHLAKALDEGSGVSRNPAEAKRWYARAAAHEHPAAQLELARRYARDANCPMAIRWYKESAESGEFQAILELGELYLKPKCGADRARAFLWFTIGSRFGSQESKAAAESLARHLSPTQKRRAQATAEQWIKAHSGALPDEDERQER